MSYYEIVLEWIVNNYNIWIDCFSFVASMVGDILEESKSIRNMWRCGQRNKRCVKNIKLSIIDD